MHGKEDAAKKVERQVRKSAAAMLLERRLGEQFDGIVTGAAEKGTWVRIFSPPIEGRLTSGYAGLDVGQRVRVQLMRTDVERGYIDLAGWMKKADAVRDLRIPAVSAALYLAPIPHFFRKTFQA